MVALLPDIGGFPKVVLVEVANCAVVYVCGHKEGEVSNHNDGQPFTKHRAASDSLTQSTIAEAIRWIQRPSECWSCARYKVVCCNVDFKEDIIYLARFGGCPDDHTQQRRHVRWRGICI
eukprot:COSAG02_NODE_373_length_23594_cov_6.892190_21_plen_119_part_00